MKLVQLVLGKTRYLAIGIILFLGLFTIIASGGPRYYYRATPSAESVNDYFIASVLPMCYGTRGCDSFSLKIENKSDKDLELDWNKTLYIANGQTAGGFMFEGVVYKDRNNPKSPDIIFANSVFSKTIWPNSLVSFSGGKYASWNHDEMTAGEHGVYLTVKVGDKEIKEKLTAHITQVQR